MQVLYPALDAKVKNVTLAYSVEHEEEVCIMIIMRCIMVLESRICDI